MNLQTKIDNRLWEAIEASVEKREYSSAILDSVYLLSDIIREKTGLSADGTSLVGQAFGGKSPKLKVNRLQTESEKNVQKGVEQLLRGLYQAVRNPRSHGKFHDTREDAEAIILFINWLLGIIDQSKAPFTMSDYLGKVFDEAFVHNKRYAELLAAEIPKSRRMDTFLEVYRRRAEGDGRKLAFFFHALCGLLEEEEKEQLAEYISDELIVTDDENEIRLTIQCLPDDWWPRYKEVARLRIENRLIESAKNGKYSVSEKRTRTGTLGTWLYKIVDHVSLRTELRDAINQLLSAENNASMDYAFRYLFGLLPKVVPKIDTYTLFTLEIGLENGDVRFRDALQPIMTAGEPENWVKGLKDKYESFEEVAKEKEEVEFDDDIPF